MQHRVEIPGGQLTLSVTKSVLALDDLCGFAARNNAKRGFLFISKLLGKHWPVTVQRMQRAHEDLALRIPSNMGPRLFIGMAETATGLGHGIFDACQRVGSDGAGANCDVYLQTTRYPVDGAKALHFEETHSHATSFRLYLPEDPGLLSKVQCTQHLVLIDDELSTGNTLASLVSAILPLCPLVRQVTLVSLTDFSNGAAAHRISKALSGNASPGSVTSVNMLQGEFSFCADTAFAPPPATVASAPVADRRACFDIYSARFGIAETPQLPASLRRELAALAGQRCLVLGTGEFMHGAFLVAQALAHSGIAATLQSTTRTPILLGSDVSSVLVVPDLYGEAIPNYLYNFDRHAHDQVLVVHETPRDAMTAQLCDMLGASSVLLRGGLESLL